MKTVDLDYAKHHLDALVDDARAGEGVEISIDSGGFIRLEFVEDMRARKFGLDQGRFVVPEDFDDPVPEIEALFLGVDDDSAR